MAECVDLTSDAADEDWERDSDSDSDSDNDRDKDSDNDTENSAGRNPRKRQRDVGHADRDGEGRKKARTSVILWGIDPGPVNCGMCKYDATRGVALELKRVEFRQSQRMGENGRRRAADTDLGNAQLVNSVSQYILVTAAEDFAGCLVPTEVQPPDANREAVAVQHAFQALMGSDKCLPVSPHAVKAHFSEYFPAKPGVPRNSAEQYRYDKRNAIVNGRRFVPRRVRDKYERENPQKKDDGYDAYWIARFAAERLVDTSTGQRMSRGPRKRARGVTNKRPQNRSVPRKEASAAAVAAYKRLRITLKRTGRP